MKEEDKQLLLKDLYARLPYTVFMTNVELPQTFYPLTCQNLYDAMYDDDWDDVPYLRPLSSMTEEEEKEFISFKDTMFRYGKDDNLGCLPLDVIDWLNKRHFDYRGLIPKGLAIEVTKDNNPYKE